jgi:hypothetical protein
MRRYSDISKAGTVGSTFNSREILEEPDPKIANEHEMVM